MPANLEMTHSQIANALDLTRNFFQVPGEKPKEFIVNPMLELSTELQKIEGFMGLLGVGYPFYAEDVAVNEVKAVPSVIQYLGSCQQSVSESAEQHGELWPCAECQIVNHLPNLTDQCVPCERVSFKPRDVFRALPDLDILTIFRESNHDTEQTVEEVLTKMGWVRFNTNIKGAFDNTVSVLSGDTSKKLPVDFHILTYEQVEEALLKIRADVTGEQVGIRGRSWRAKWKDQPVDITYSLLFSMTEIGSLDPELSAMLQATRQELSNKHSVDELISVVERSKRCGPVIGDLSLRGILQRRLQCWTE